MIVSTHTIFNILRIEYIQLWAVLPKYVLCAAIWYSNIIINTFVMNVTYIDVNIFQVNRMKAKYLT